MLLLLSTCFISACSTYKTNSETTFTSTLLSGQEPVIHVGEITEKPDKLVLLGWVEASVSKPSVLAKDPTEEQANIILAEKGEALGADAIIYVTYKTRIGTLFLNKIEARGQAVKLKDNTAQLQGIKPRRAIIDPLTPETGPQNTESNTLTETVTKGPEPEIDYTDRNNDENIPDTVEEVMKIKATSAPKNAEPVSLKTAVVEQNNEKEQRRLSELEKQSKSCEATLEDVVAYEADYDALNYMIMNADFIMKKSRGLEDEDMQSASLRLMQLLEQQLAKLKAGKPVIKP